MSGLTHFDEAGRAHMVDVGEKEPTLREAVAEGVVRMSPATLELVTSGRLGKGDALGVARLAGIMAAKRTPDLIPLCHPLALSHVAVDLEPDATENCVRIIAHCRLTGRTGVEMEALTAVAVAGLTLYDMCKSVDRGMEIGPIRLVSKSGGRSGTYP